jgi:adenylate cyclase
LFRKGERDEAVAEADLAVRLNPDSFDAANAAGSIAYQLGDFENAARHFRKAGEASDVDFAVSGMVMSACAAMGDVEGARAGARLTLERAERVLSQDRSNGHAMAFGANALATLGDAQRSKEWIARALLVDPDNMLMRYNFACVLCQSFSDCDRALELLEPVFASDAGRLVRASPNDPDLAALRDDPRFQAMIARAEARLAESKSG